MSLQVQILFQMFLLGKHLGLKFYYSTKFHDICFFFLFLICEQIIWFVLLLYSTPIFTGDGDGGSGFAAAAVAGGMSGYDFGVDPNVDPELALALRVSMEEERARQEAAAKKAAEDAARQEKGDQASHSRDTVMAEADLVHLFL